MSVQAKTLIHSVPEIARDKVVEMKYFVGFVLIAWMSVIIHASDDDSPTPAEVPEIQEIVPFIGNGSVSLQMPFMVSVRQSSHELLDRHFGNGHVCGGVILSRNHILTAASCIQIRQNRIPTEEIFVIAGTRYRYVNDGVVRIEASNITIHPSYTFDPLNNNLAIIQLNSSLPEDVEMIAPIEFSNTTVAVGERCQIFGWGLPLSVAKNL